MKKACLLLALTWAANVMAQTSLATTSGGSARLGASADSTSNNKEIPKGVRVWTVDKRFGDITRQQMDTVTHMFPNTLFTSGLRGEYNTLGNLGTPRINRIFIDRQQDDGDFLFTQPYDYVVAQPNDFLFTNTLSPYSNISYNTCGDRTNGEDHFTAKFSVNAGRKFGFGFKINYLYGRGYYSDQSTSNLGINLYGSYIDDQYQAHLLITTYNQKIAENGGITNDDYITHPESFGDNYATSEIPTMMSSNWNRNKSQHVFLTHRYSLGFRRQVRMTEEEIEAKKFAMQSKEDNKDKDRMGHRNGEEEEVPEMSGIAGRPDDAAIMGDFKQSADSLEQGGRQELDLATADSLIAKSLEEEPDTSWMKSEFVPVTSFIHTAQLASHDRIYQAYTSPTDYYANDYYDEDVIGGDSIYDQTKFFRLRNTFAISLLEGFNKWAFAGLKFFAASDLRHYSLPNDTARLTSYNDHNFSIGAQMSRTQGSLFHYNVTAETWLLGDDQGQVKVDANLALNFPLFGDTVTLAANGFFHNEKPNYYLRHYHSRHFWWDDDLGSSTHTRIEGLFSYQKTRTKLRIAVDELTNYTYLSGTYNSDSTLYRVNHDITVKQSGDPITLLTASLQQDFTLGPVNWETVVTWQKSTNQDVLPVPSLNIYTNLYLKFRVAKVLYSEIGADLRYFTEYAAPDYAPAIGQFVVQGNEEKTKLGNYPIINAYASFNLKGTRFFIMYTHVNNGSGNRRAFLTPHYPINGSILRFGLSWNFYN